MWNRLTSASTISLFLLLTVAWSLGQKPKLAPAPEVYEVSKSGKVRQKLMQIFAAVNKAYGGKLTKDEFIRRLKAREHFEVRFPEKCRTCNGWKRVSPTSGKRGADGKVKCRTCRGSGVERRPYVVKWSADVNTHSGDKRNPRLAALKRELGNDASAYIWFSTAYNYHKGELKTKPDARAYAHAAYQESVKVANEAWRPKEPTTSEHNRLHRTIIDKGLIGISETAPKREEKNPEATPKPPVLDLEGTQ